MMANFLRTVRAGSKSIASRGTKSRLALAFSALALILTGCTQTLIVYKPSAKVDPMPELENKPTAEKEDPQAKDQWHLTKLGVTKEVLKGHLLDGNYNVKVALLSTGIDYNHEDLRGQVAINTEEITQDQAGKKPGVNRIDDDKNGLVDDVVGWDVVDGDGFAYDRHGAGTAVAGIIAARSNNGVGVAGLMKQVSLYPIRYIDDNGTTSVARLAAALEIAIKSRAHVVFIQNTQFRLGGHEGNPEVAAVEAQLLKKYFDELRLRKVPVVIGAGDNMADFGSDAVDKVIRGMDNIAVVTSSTKEDQRSFLANFNPQDVLLAAPGDKLLTTRPFGKYGEVSGTAYAAAQVTAAIALARGLIGDRAASDKIMPLLMSIRGGDPVPQLQAFTFSGTRLNVVKFLTEIKSL